jgi:L-alanine-DL-glutamate epimerase-like enolase superfamily enzyme
MALRLSVERRVLRFREPLAAAHGVLTERPLLAIEVRDHTGLVGHGEAAPLESYDGVSLQATEVELRAASALFAAAEGVDPGELRALVAASVEVPQARAALDTALWDLEARRKGEPLAALLSDRPAGDVVVNASIGALRPDRAAAAAHALIAEGFTAIKVKVGTGDDLARVRAIRAAIGEGPALRIDANGAWTVTEAVERLTALAACRLELCEEPVHGLAELADVRAQLGGTVAIAADESATEPGALQAPGIDAVCLKLTACGGVSGLLAAAREAAGAGKRVVIASTYDGPVGIAAAVHVAAALDPSPLACGLATLSLFDGAEPPALRPLAGRIAVPAGPGLGL